MRARVLPLALLLSLGAVSLPAAAAPDVTVAACPTDAVPESGLADVRADLTAAVDCAVWWALLSGTGATTFAPDAPVTRAQAAWVLTTLVDRLAPGTLPDDAPPAFTDTGGIFSTAVDRAAAAGIVLGTAPGLATPERAVTRGEWAALVLRALRATGLDLADAAPTFPDVDVDGPLGAAIGAAAAAGLVDALDDDAYAPGTAMSRGLVAVVLTRGLALGLEEHDVVRPDAADWVPTEQPVAPDPYTSLASLFGPFGIDFGSTVNEGDVAALGRRVGIPTAWPPTDAEAARIEVRAAARAAEPYPVLLTWDGIDVLLPSTGTELVGWHQSTHEGARNTTAVGDVVPMVVMESRGRLSGSRSAADVVIAPGIDVVAPVTGRVVRSGTYTLYCRYSDDFLVIEPDGRPGIEVKLLHIDGVRVFAGDRVVAGETVVANGPTPLPFASQVDALSHWRDWPHAHLEVVDTSIPNIPSPGGGC